MTPTNKLHIEYRQKTKKYNQRKNNCDHYFWPQLLSMKKYIIPVNRQNRYGLISNLSYKILSLNFPILDEETRTNI